MNSRDEWPFGALKVKEIAGLGIRIQPFQEFVLKVHQQCNLACDYCYVYTSPDQTWRAKPAAMSAEVWRAAAFRIAEHAEAHNLQDVRVVLHGGEPLLAGRQRLIAMVADLRTALSGVTDVRFTLQTNGILLDERMLDALAELGVAVGVSLDGSPDANDLHRRRLNGRGSFSAVDKALALLRQPKYERLFTGLLCTIDPNSDPRTTYETLLGYSPPTIDFLFPHANWSNPPQRNETGATRHGDWLATIFDRWYDAPRQETRIRLFEEIMSLLLGGASRSEQVGLSPVVVAVIESDGAIEQVDSLKSAYSGACATGLDVFGNRLDDALAHPGILARQIGLTALCASCRSCPIHLICGGGHYAHRYRPGAGFRNPSVYCADLMRLIEHIQTRVIADLAARVARIGL